MKQIPNIFRQRSNEKEKPVDWLILKMVFAQKTQNILKSSLRYGIY